MRERFDLSAGMGGVHARKWARSTGSSASEWATYGGRGHAQGEVRFVACVASAHHWTCERTRCEGLVRGVRARSGLRPIGGRLQARRALASVESEAGARRLRQLRWFCRRAARRKKLWREGVSSQVSMLTVGNSTRAPLPRPLQPPEQPAARPVRVERSCRLACESLRGHSS